MQFKDVVGQESVKQKLITAVAENRVPHAQLFLGPAGCGKTALALAYAQYLLCENRHDGDSCGVCPSCQKLAKLIHPDLHFLFPTTTNKRVKDHPESELFYEEWQNYIRQCEGYADINEWHNFIGAENKQGIINVRDAASIIRKLSFKAYEGEYKVAIIWMAERMNTEAANKLLKLLEEPPEKTVFILIAEEQEELLATIRSRSMLLKIPKIDSQSVAHALAMRSGCTEADCRTAVTLADGNWITARLYHEQADIEKEYFETFRQWMRLCFKAEVGELVDFVANVKTLGRERQKALLGYGLDMFHNSVMFNNMLGSFVPLPDEEASFGKSFAPFINPANVVQVTELFEEGIRQIERNGNAQIIFLDISLKMCKELKKK